MTNISNTLNSDDNFEILYQLIDDGDFAQAIKLATQCTQIEPDNPEVWIMLATTQRELELFEEATHSIRKAIALSPDTAKYYCALGLTLEHLGQIDQALPQYKAGFRLDPSSNLYRQYLGRATFRVGAAYGDQSMVKNGLELLEIAVKNDPQDQDAIDKLAGCYLDAVIIGWFPDPDGRSISYPISKTHVDQAEQFIQKAEHLHPQDPDILVYLKERKKLIKDMMRRKFSGRYRPGLALIFLSFFLILAGKILTILFGFGLLITGITYFVACRRPQYITNAKLLAGQGLTVFDRVQIGLDKIGSSIFIYGSITDVIFMKLIFYSLFRTIETVIGMILVPFVTLYCLYENYLADN